MQETNPPQALRPAGPSAPGAKAERAHRFREECFQKICESIATHGLAESHAALLHEVSVETLRRWKKRQPRVGPALGKARAQFHQARLEAIRTVADGTEKKVDWRAQAWLLENAAQEEPAPEAKAEHGQRNALVISAEQLAELQRRREAALRATRIN